MDCSRNIRRPDFIIIRTSRSIDSSEQQIYASFHIIENTSNLDYKEEREN
jgi:hypothetical protein